MKRLIFLAIIALFALASCAPKTADCGRHGMISEQEGWFTVKDITPSQSVGNVWLISEHGDATCYLVTGTKYAMLIDTGIGVGDLSGLVRSLTDLPLIVVNTHGHPDHVGANYQFTEVWMPEKDMDIFYEMNPLNNPDLEAYVASNSKDFVYDKEAVKKNVADIKAYDPYKINMLNEGQSVDLGDKVIKTIALGGHTPGGIMFIDETDNILFSGDALNGYLWMWLDTCLSLEEFEQNLAAVLPKISHLGRIYGGHEFRAEGVEIYQAERVLKDLRSAIAGEVQPVPTPTPMNGEGTVNVYYFDTWLLWAK
ncbi:MAG: MBL fold metallo-hydrolase [Bacteroidales bacterium]|nr:MBL fold metallo-hydrolase [Bacteroidales bacterium]